MAPRISRRVKYVVVLALVTIFLYASLGTNRAPDGSFDDLEFESQFRRPGESEDFKQDDAPQVVKEITIATIQPEPEKPIEKTVPRPFVETEDSRSSTTSNFASSVQPTPAPDESQPESSRAAEPLPTVSPADTSPREKFQLDRKERFPVNSKQRISLPTSKPAKIPRIQTEDPSKTETEQEKKIRTGRRDAIRNVFKQDWSAYRTYAWMHDELRPVTNSSLDPFGGWGATLVDSLDTLLIMDLLDEYEEAAKAVAGIDFTYTESQSIPVFETTIRYLGGLLAAHDLAISKGLTDSTMLSQAKILGKVLYGAFDTPNRMPILHFDYRKQAAASPDTVLRADRGAVMAEPGSLTVEFTRLAQLSDGEDRDIFFDAIQRVVDAYEESMDSMVVPGLWPLRLDLSGCKMPPKPTPKPNPSQAPRPDISTANNAKGSGAPVAALIETVADKAEKASDRLLEVLQDKKSDAERSKDPAAKRQSPQSAPREPEENAKSSDSEQEKGPPCEKQGIRAPPGIQMYAIGGMADSTYEYFTKQYLLLGGVAEADQYKKLYELSMEATKKWLLYKPLVPGDLGAHELLFAGEVAVQNEGRPTFHAKMQHLTCFVGGMFAMGSKVFNRPEDLSIAARLTDGCVWAYNFTETGVAPEVFHMHECKDDVCSWADFQHKQTHIADPDVFEPTTETTESNGKTSDATTTDSKQKRQTSPNSQTDDASVLASKNFENSQASKSPPVKNYDSGDEAMFWVDPTYKLRPEAIESVWYMYRITGDKIWQEKGWKMWLATEELTRTPIAHSAVTQIMYKDQVTKTDSLESFWFAETLKYYYLLFCDFDTISLDEYVLNTEAHPFKRPS